MKTAFVRLLVRNAQCRLDKMFSTYSDDIVSTCNLRSVVSDMFFSDDIIIIHYHVPYVHLVKFILFYFSLLLLPML